VAAKEADAAALVEALTEWARRDLLSAYEALCLALHWREKTRWHAVWDGGLLCGVAARLESRYADQGPARFYYAARNEAALQELLAAAPPEPGSRVCAPDTPSHAVLRSLPEDGEDRNQVLYVHDDQPAPDSPEVSHLTPEEAIAGGLADPWHWPSILGIQPAPRPIHCISRDGRIVAVAAAGCPTPLTEEVRAVWVTAELRQQGLGRAVVAAATRDILSRGLMPTYTTGLSNIASQRTAESVGYTRQGEMLRAMMVG
jgi:GNAT superfamily N-acetyltransferase